jgi:hypothetical protein
MAALHFAFVADAVQAAEHLDQQLLRRVDLCDRQVLRHLLGETFQQVPVASNRFLKCIHHRRAHQVLRRDHVAQIEFERLLEHGRWVCPFFSATATNSS